MTPDSTHRSAPPSASGPARRGPKIALALGAVALLAILALLARGANEERGKPEAQKSATPSAQPADSAGMTAGGGQSGKGAPEEAIPAPRRFVSTTCWQELERFNEAVTLKTFRSWAAPLLAAKDPLVLEYIKGRLGELIGNDEGRASEVLGWARDGSPAEFKVFMGGLRNSQAILRPKVSAQLVAMGLDEHLDLGRRAGVLDELQSLQKLEPAALDKLAHFAQDASSGEAGWIATRAIGQVMKEDFNRTGNAKPYVDKLVSIGAESMDEHVRYLALEMVMHANAPLDASTAERLGKVLTTEGSEDIRQVAAHDLSLSQDKTKALEIYSKAFQTERDLCVRWAIFRFAARAAGKDALPAMANMAIADPRFEGDYHDFERLYASGIVDFDRIWFGLPSQDPHGCLAHAD